MFTGKNHRDWYHADVEQAEQEQSDFFEPEYGHWNQRTCAATIWD